MRQRHRVGYDYRAIILFIIMVTTSLAYNLYFYELFYGSWDKISAKALYYSVTCFVLLYLTIDEMFGYSSHNHREISLICKLVLFCNFGLFALILTDQLSKPKLWLYLLDGTVFVLSFMILIATLRNEFFKN